MSDQRVRWLSGEGVGLYKSEGCWFDSPTVPNDVVSLGKALHPTCLWENVPVLTVSRTG